jgi:integrase
MTQADWHWIRRIESRVRARHVPARSKRGRLVGAAELLALGCTLMESAPAQSTERLRAMQFRDGLLIALLAARPLRLKNLTGLALEHSLVRRGEDWWIIIPAEETKTREPIEAPWPEGLNRALETYLATYRPILYRLRNRWTGPVGPALWVSTHGSPMGQPALYEAIVGRTGSAFGRPINPHLFRDCTATSIAIEDPAHVRIASQILGHRSSATTERYYNQAQAIDAARRYQHFLVALRNGTIAEDIDSV